MTFDPTPSRIQWGHLINGKLSVEVEHLEGKE